MPTVGKKKFKYDEEGMAAAEAEAAATGQEVASEEEAIDNIVSDLGDPRPEMAADMPADPTADPTAGEEPPVATVSPDVLAQLYEAVHGVAFDPQAEGAEAKMREIENVIAGNPQVAEGLTDGSVSLTEAALVLFRQVDLGEEQPIPQAPAPEMAEGAAPDVGAYL